MITCVFPYFGMYLYVIIYVIIYMCISLYIYYMRIDVYTSIHLYKPDDIALLWHAGTPYLMSRYFQFCEWKGIYTQ